MRRSRLVAILTIPPLALALAWLVAHERVDTWLESEPVLVQAGQVGAPHAVGGFALTVDGAQVVDAGSDAAGYADAPEGAQVVVVDVRLEDADDVSAWCSFRLEATVDGERATWAQDAGASEVTSCYDETGSLGGPVGFVVPAGSIEDARLLVGGEVVWLGVPLPL